MATLAPSRARAMARPRPMRLAPPVTRTRLPFRELIGSGYRVEEIPDAVDDETSKNNHSEDDGDGEQNQDGAERRADPDGVENRGQTRPKLLPERQGQPVDAGGIGQVDFDLVFVLSPILLTLP